MTWWMVCFALILVGAWLALHWGMHWGSTSRDRAQPMPGDDYLEGDRPSRVAMTRAISIRAHPPRVWPWIAQLGRGAGWYSIDWLDNGRKVSARHLVSWIPEPCVGDATAIGYLREVAGGQSLAWWLGGTRFLGAQTRLVTSYRLVAEEQGTRVISRISADAVGPTAHLALFVFRAIDSIMACRQLIGLRNRVESVEAGDASQTDPESGDRAQYQRYEVIYANGDGAGIAGKEGGATWRQAAIRDGVLDVAE